MQQWAVLVLPHASICDAPAFNYILTYLSLSFTSHSLMWVHTSANLSSCFFGTISYS